MAEIPCVHKVDCPGSDFPISNYSSEGPEQEPEFCSVVFPTNWTQGGCMTVCCLPESQNAADLCALQQIAVCPPDPPDPPDICLTPPCLPVRFCNVEFTKCCTNSDGAQSCYTVPAGTFCAATQEAADAQAEAYAQVHCNDPETSVRLGAIDACTCLGSEYDSRIAYEGSAPFLWIVQDGVLPDGLELNTSTGRITGTTESYGIFVFSIKAFIAGGNYATRTYAIYVLTITTAALDNYTLGVEYSEQLEADGGSGNYNWSVFSGNLPTGLTLSATGLISGTPTADDGSDTITFSVIDTTCETFNRSNFRPAVRLSTRSTTLLRTKRGYPEYVVTDGTLYKKITFSGSITQTVIVPATQVSASFQCAGATYLYSGSTEIDASGNFISRHRKDLLVPCTLVTAWPAVAEGPNALGALAIPGTFWDESRIHKMLGYCFLNDYGNSPCSTCNFISTSWTPYGNYQTPSAFDAPVDMLTNPGGFVTNATSFAYSGMVTGQFNTDANIQILTQDANTLVTISSNGAYGATLSEPYTDADAIATQRTIVSTSATAENLPDYLRVPGQQWLVLVHSRLTTVEFTLRLTNLLVDETYLVSYDLFNSNGDLTTISQLVTATATTQDVTGTIALPSDGNQITIRNPTVTYS